MVKWRLHASRAHAHTERCAWPTPPLGASPCACASCACTHRAVLGLITRRSVPVPVHAPSAYARTERCVAQRVLLR
eukprot:5295318-Pleurochrysis_carterae.AAC.1